MRQDIVLYRFSGLVALALALSVAAWDHPAAYPYNNVQAKKLVPLALKGVRALV